MLEQIKDIYKADPIGLVKNLTIGAGIGLVLVCAFPYLIAGTGLALGFWIGRKAVGQMEKKE